MGDDSLTSEGRAAIAALKRLSQRWPRSLTLASMDGDLVVVRTGDDAFLGDGSADRQESVIEDLGRRIPNTGGAW